MQRIDLTGPKRDDKGNVVNAIPVKTVVKEESLMAIKQRLDEAKAAAEKEDMDGADAFQSC